jgi:hypothetical protein
MEKEDNGKKDAEISITKNEPTWVSTPTFKQQKSMEYVI